MPKRSTTIAHYSFQNLDTGEYEGLLRFDPSAANYERAGAGGWEPGDPERLKMFVSPGADAPDLIDDALAKQLAARYGVEIN